MRLKLFGEGAEALRAFSIFDAGARKLTLKSVRPANQGAVASLPKSPIAALAEALRGTGADGPSLGAAVARREYYHHDLIGLPCVSTDGEAVSTVVAVEISAPATCGNRTDGEAGQRPKRFMVPMTAQAVPYLERRGVTVAAAFVE